MEQVAVNCYSLLVLSELLLSEKLHYNSTAKDASTVAAPILPSSAPAPTQTPLPDPAAAQPTINMF